MLVQAVAAGAVATMAEARDLVARSFPIVTYEPAGDWTEAHGRFARISARQADRRQEA